VANTLTTLSLTSPEALSVGAAAGVAPGSGKAAARPYPVQALATMRHRIQARFLVHASSLSFRLRNCDCSDRLLFLRSMEGASQ